MPESPRWLCNKDRHEEALAVFSRWHCEEFQAKKSSSFSDFLKTKGNRKRIIIITAIGFFSQWSGNGLISYYLKYVMVRSLVYEQRLRYTLTLYIVILG